MIIRRSRRYTVKMADYESYVFGADVEMSHHDLGVSDAALAKATPEQRKSLQAKLTTKILTELQAQLENEINDACELTTNQKSFLRKAFGFSKQGVSK